MIMYLQHLLLGCISAYLSVFALAYASLATRFGLGTTSDTDPKYWFADLSRVWNPFNSPHVARSVPAVVRHTFFVFDDSVFGYSAANSFDTFDLSTDTSCTLFRSTNTSTSTGPTPKFSFSVSSA